MPDVKTLFKIFGIEHKCNYENPIMLGIQHKCQIRVETFQIFFSIIEWLTFAESKLFSWSFGRDVNEYVKGRSIVSHCHAATASLTALLPYCNEYFLDNTDFWKGDMKLIYSRSISFHCIPVLQIYLKAWATPQW